MKVHQNQFTEDLGKDGWLAVDDSGTVLGAAGSREDLEKSMKTWVEQNNGAHVHYLQKGDIEKGEPDQAENRTRIVHPDTGVGDKLAPTSPSNRMQDTPAVTQHPQQDPDDTATADDKKSQDAKNAESQAKQPDPAGDGSTAHAPRGGQPLHDLGPDTSAKAAPNRPHADDKNKGKAQDDSQHGKTRK